MIEFLQAVRAAEYRPFDIMIEAKARDLALLRLREHLLHYAPELAAVVW